MALSTGDGLFCLGCFILTGIMLASGFGWWSVIPFVFGVLGGLTIEE